MDDMLNAEDDSDGYGTIEFTSSRPNGAATLPPPSSSFASPFLVNGPSRLQPPDNESDGEDHVYAQPNLLKKHSRSKEQMKEEEEEELGRRSNPSPSSTISSSHHHGGRRKSDSASERGEKPEPPPKIKESLKMVRRAEALGSTWQTCS